MRPSWSLLLVVITLLIITPSTTCHVPDHVILIESPGCLKCAQAERTLEKVLQDYPGVQITSYNAYTEDGHRIIREYHVKDVPWIVIGDTAIGYNMYKGDAGKLEQMIRAAMNRTDSNISSEGDWNTSSTSGVNGTDGKGDATDIDTAIVLEKLNISSMATVLAAGLLAGFNPCLLAILAFMASAVIASSGRRRDIVSLVVFFSAGIFTVYYLFGVGTFRLFQENPSLETGLRAFLVAILLILGLLQLEDARRLHAGAKSIFRTDWILQYFERAISNGRFGSYFLMGALFSLVKLPCIGAVYIAILEVISSEGYRSSGLVYLILYNLGIIMPVLALGGAMAFGTSPDTVDRFRHDHRVGIRLVTGLTLVILAPLIYWQLV